MKKRLKVELAFDFDFSDPIWKKMKPNAAVMTGVIAGMIGAAVEQQMKPRGPGRVPSPIAGWEYLGSTEVE